MGLSGLSVALNRVIPIESLDKDLKLIFLSNIVGAFGDGLYVYILPLFLRDLNASSADVGFLFSIFTLSTALTIIPGGFLADRYDRKKVMILGWLIWVPVPLIFSLATYWTQLVPVMGLYGFFIAGPATSAYVMTRARKGSVTLTYTMLSGSWWFGYILSPGLGGYLSASIGMQGVFFLAFVFYSAATGILFLLRSQRVEKPALAQTSISNSPSPRRKIILLSVFFAVVYFFFSLVRPLVVQLFQDVHQLQSFHIGVLGSIGFLGSAFFSIGIGKFGDRFGKMTAATVSLLISGLSFGLFAMFSQFYALSIASLLNGASYTLWPIMGASVGSITPEASRGRWISVAQMSATLAGSVAPFIGGIIYQSSPYASFYIVAAISPLLALIALTKPFKESKTS